MRIELQDVTDIFPRPLMKEEEERASKLIQRSLELITLEFARRGRSLDAELATSTWLSIAVKHAVTSMVSEAVTIGENIGRSSVSSTTGPQSDSISFSQGVGIKWGGVGIDADILALLGLAASVVPRGRGGTIIPFGTTRPIRGAEFSERRWS